ncbi:hypothetical protein GCM10009798_26010 [Nocardioides panacihumi]|uniref:HTH luxR-type domain-containing protein n=1 Tax=Nocardioides panacihumi TaxID=400774 RepID=A0ABN2R7B4_9ACTN
MAATERRTSEWVDLIGDLLARPVAAFPHALLTARLHDTFGSQVGWSWFDSPDRCGFELHTPIPGFPTPEVRKVINAAVPHHPVLRWFNVTGDHAPMSIGRVPAAMVDQVARDTRQEFFVPLGVEHQVVILYEMSGATVRAFILSRGRQDFTDSDLKTATMVQPLLVLLDRQISAYRAWAPNASTDLTGRELAVLRLLAEGRTAAGIAARLAISERTVHRHLEHVYRKLGARDRVTAVLAARDADLLPPTALEPAPTNPR